jgi:hypothetical protein
MKIHLFSRWLDSLVLLGISIMLSTVAFATATGQAVVHNPDTLTEVAANLSARWAF